MSIHDPNSPPVPEPLPEDSRLPHLITIVAVLIVVVLGIVALSLV